MQPRGSLESDDVYIVEQLLRTFSGVSGRPDLFFRSFQAGFSVSVREPTDYSCAGCEGFFNFSSSCTPMYPQLVHTILFNVGIKLFIICSSFVEHKLDWLWHMSCGKTDSELYLSCESTTSNGSFSVVQQPGETPFIIYQIYHGKHQHYGQGYTYIMGNILLAILVCDFESSLASVQAYTKLKEQIAKHS